MRNNDGDKPSKWERTRYAFRKLATPLQPNLDGIMFSENESVTSLSSVSSEETDATSLISEEQCNTLENLFVQKAEFILESTFTRQQINFQRDLANYLRDAISGHTYMCRLRLAGLDIFDTRPSVLITTKSARTKLELAKCLRKGPSILKRMPDSSLNIHIVFDRSGVSCDAFDSLCVSSEEKSPSSPVWFTLESDMNGEWVHLKKDQAGRDAKFVGGGELLLGNRPVRLSPYHALAIVEGNKRHWIDAGSAELDIEGVEDYKGALSIFADDVFDPCGLAKIIGPFPRFSSKKTLPIDFDSSCQPRSLPHRSFVSPTDKNFPNRFLYSNETSFTESTKASSTLSQHHNDVCVVENTAPEVETWPVTGRLSVDILAKSPCADWILTPSSRTTKDVSQASSYNLIDGYVVDEFYRKKIDSRLEVTIALPDGNKRGCLQPQPVYYQIGTHQYELLAVKLDEPLPRGRSNAWVVHKNKAVGVLMAVEDDLPEVYIMPFTVILQDIERVTGKSLSLSTARNSSFCTLPCFDSEIHKRRSSPPANDYTMACVSALPAKFNTFKDMLSDTLARLIAQRSRRNRKNQKDWKNHALGMLAGHDVAIDDHRVRGNIYVLAIEIGFENSIRLSAISRSKQEAGVRLFFDHRTVIAAVGKCIDALHAILNAHFEQHVVGHHVIGSLSRDIEELQELLLSIDDLLSSNVLTTVVHGVDDIHQHYGQGDLGFLLGRDIKVLPSSKPLPHETVSRILQLWTCNDEDWWNCSPYKADVSPSQCHRNSCWSEPAKCPRSEAEEAHPSHILHHCCEVSLDQRPRAQLQNHLMEQPGLKNVVQVNDANGEQKNASDPEDAAKDEIFKLDDAERLKGLLRDVLNFLRTLVTKLNEGEQTEPQHKRNQKDT